MKRFSVALVLSVLVAFTAPVLANRLSGFPFNQLTNDANEITGMPGWSFISGINNVVTATTTTTGITEYTAERPCIKGMALDAINDSANDAQVTQVNDQDDGVTAMENLQCREVPINDKTTITADMLRTGI